MITRIKRVECIEKYPRFPQIFNEDEFYYPEIINAYVLVLPMVPINKYLSRLSQQFSLLISLFGLDEIIFLGEYKTAWRKQDNDYKPVKKALEYLEMQNIGIRFNGGIEVNREDLPTFVMHLFWLTRYNAFLPVFHFMDRKQRIVGNICKYGSVHIQTLNNRADKKIQTILGNLEFSILKGGCREQFSKTGGVKGE